ncbi:MAG: AraC family transcriptional regulator [Clostridia bacterium]|nr:AraC family transcriptional regulator [Clostridia bacterium]
MLGGIINFSEIPDIGFSHHFYTDKEYKATYALEKSLEIAYIESGNLLFCYENEQFAVKEGSILVLFRHLPIRLYADEKKPFSHCCMQLLFDYDFELITPERTLKSIPDGIVLPFIFPPCKETEEIKKLLFSAVYEYGISEKNKLLSVMNALTILQKISNIYKNNLHQNQKTQSLFEYKIKKYVASNLSEKITIDEIARKLNRTPNYLNSVFKKECGITIGQYISKEKVRFIAEIIRKENVSFAVACQNAGISDISYGYRLFKKHMGITPKEYISCKKKELTT